MAFDPDAYLAEPSGFDPDAYLAGTPTPSPTPTAVADTGEGDGFLAKINAALRKPSPDWLQAPEQATRENIMAMLPHDVPSYLRSIGGPVVAGYEQAKSLAEGDVSSIPLVGRVPEIIQAEETPAFSKERYGTAERTVMDLLALAGAGAGERPPLRAEPTLAERITQPRVEPAPQEPLAPVTPETPPAPEAQIFAGMSASEVGPRPIPDTGARSYQVTHGNSQAVVNVHPDAIGLQSISTPMAARGQGSASALIENLKSESNATGKPIIGSLGPEISPEFWTNRGFTIDETGTIRYEPARAPTEQPSGAEPPPTEPPVAESSQPLPQAPAPKTRKFSLQLQADTDLIQNLKDKIGNRTYEPIPNKITADQAVNLVDERPIPDVINAVKDEHNGMPGHVRSAMGQIVIKRLNRAAERLGTEGKTADADIAMNQAVNLAEWMQEFGTRSGQTVQSFAMWSALTPEGKLISVTRKVRKARANFEHENPGQVDEIIEVAKQSADEAKGKFDSIADSIARQLSDTPTFKAQGQADPARALIRAHLKEPQPDFVNRIIKYGADRNTAEIIDRLAVENRERILKVNRVKRAEQLRQMFTRQNRVARKLTKKNWERILELADHGLLTDKSFIEAAGERLGLPRYDAKVAGEIMRMAQEIDRLPEGMPRDQAVFNLNRFIATKMGFRLSDLPMGVYYGNMLSGYNTHIVNALDTFLNVGSELSGIAISNPRSAMKIFGNSLKGFNEGRADALMALTRGRMLTNSRWMEMPRLMEVAKFGEKGGVPPLGKGLAGRIVTRLAESKVGYPLNAWKYVGRLMSASDSIMFRGAKEGRAALLADRLARDEGLRGKALNRRVQEELGRTTEQETLFHQQAKDEGFSGSAQQARVNELRERSRSMEANADADDFAGIATYNHKPQGMLGYMAGKVGEASNRYPALRTIVPFTQIVANVTNRGLNYTPWGFKRAFRGYSGELPPKGDARRVMLARATMGSTGLGLLYTLQQQGAVEIHGAGPSDPDKRKQLMEAGWKPYSIKMGDHYLSYLVTPLGLGLSILGNMSDVQRYGEMDQKSALLRGTYALSRVGSTIFSQSFLSSLSTLFEALSGQSPGQQLSALRRLFSGITGTATTPRIVLDVQRIFDPRRYESNTIAGDLLKNTPFSAMVNRPILNAFGEPIEPPSNRFISAVSDDPAWRAIAEANLRVPVPDKYTNMPDGRGGKRQITPEEYYEYLEKSGPLVKQYIVWDTFNLTHMSPDKAQDLLSKKSQEIRERVLKDIRRRAQITPAD